MSKHGVFIVEEATALTVPISSRSSVQVVIGTAPVNMAEDPAAVVNTPILANSAAEAMAALGYRTDTGQGKYKPLQTMYATKNLYQVTTVVDTTVQDHSTHIITLTQTRTTN